MNLAKMWSVLALLLAIPQANAQTYTRTEVIEYHDDLSQWALGQVAKTICVAPAECKPAYAPNGIVVSQTDYNASGLPYKTYAFGKLQQTLTYNADATLATAADGRNNTTTFSNWKRGLPQSILYADSSSESGVVNDDGSVASVTDENGYKTCYDYDVMGRLAGITYPSESQLGVCDTTTWTKQTRWFGPVPYEEHGLGAGHWTMSRRLGNRHINTYYDALWRPVLEEQLDYADVPNTLSQVVKRYDSEGRLAFQSYPARGVGNVQDALSGTSTAYDALGRVTQVKQDSEFGPLTTTTEYLAGLQTRVTNPRNIATTTGYFFLDRPGYDQPAWIQHPEGAYTDITRDVFGKPKSVVRRNADSSQRVTRGYVYDGYQQLCKTIEPETGATVSDYDAAGNLQWNASGLNLPSDTNCDTIAGRDSGRKVMRYYDARNRVTTVNFPDGNGDQNFEYWPDGLAKRIVTFNDAGTTSVVNAYDYNKRRLLTAESVTQPGWYWWPIAYGYDANANLSAINYPTNLTIDYAPNALGQPTKAGSYASGVQYYPNGGIKQFTYGNGIVHTMTQNARQLPNRSSDLGGPNTPLDYTYSYDKNANVTVIADAALGDHYSRWMSYDNLDRLKDAGSCSFGGDCYHRFTYDALDNLKSWKLPGVKDYANYYYDSSSRLTSIQNSAGASIVGLGYDLQGNLQNKNGQNYVFDYGNRLREVTGKEGLYRYDGYGRRVLNWRPDSTITLSQYSQSGQVLYQENSSKTLAIENVYLGGSLLASRERNWVSGAITTKYQHTDALGSPVAVTNESGQVIERTQWEPYGAAINKTVDGVGYTGHVMDAATGLTYMQQRYYDPGIGRFLSVDPVTAYGGDMRHFNLYAYAYNNPYSFTDPDGRAGEFVALRGFMTFVAADAATPDPSDAAAPGKVPVYASAIAGLAIGGGIMWVYNQVAESSNEGEGSGEAAPQPVGSGGAKETPALPTGLVGENPRATGKNGGKAVGTSLPAGDFEPTVEGLTGGNLSPHPKIPGAQQAPNGVVVRPGKNGPRIDIPENGTKPPEIVHFPKGADGK